MVIVVIVVIVVMVDGYSGYGEGLWWMVMVNSTYGNLAKR
jgi:hypothetical protein